MSTMRCLVDPVSLYMCSISPLTDGPGHGRVRISMVFRSIQLQLSRELLGWEYGTLQITSDISSSDLPEDCKKLDLKLHTPDDSTTMSSQQGTWSGRQGQPVELAIQQRYCASLRIKFQRSGPMHRHCLAFAVLQLREIPDDEERTMTLVVWEGESSRVGTDSQTQGKELGHLQIRLRFLPGLSQQHQQLPDDFPGLEDVIEVLVMANEDGIRLVSEDGASEGNSDALNRDAEQLSSPVGVKEQGNKLHRTKAKFRQWKVSLISQQE